MMTAIAKIQRPACAVRSKHTCHCYLKPVACRGGFFSASLFEKINPKTDLERNCTGHLVGDDSQKAVWVHLKLGSCLRKTRMERSQLLAATLPVISAALCVTFFSLWVSQRANRHVLDWSFSYLCGFLGSALGMARIFLADPEWFSFIGNGLLVGMAYFGARGVNIRCSGQTHDRKLLPVLVVTIAAGFWYGFVDPNVIARGAASSLGAAVMFLIATRIILRSKNTDTVDILIATAFVVTAAMLVARPLAVYLLDEPIRSEDDVTGSWWGISFRILATLSWVSIAILFIHRVTSDLLNDLATQSRTDLLTAIPNRRGFFSLAEGLEKNQTVAVMLCDLDEFKAVNDTYGHGTGDIVLKGFARILREVQHPGGRIIGRLGGEEFVVVLQNADAIQSRALAESIRTAFSDTRHDGIPSSHAITVSIGVAVAHGTEPIDAVLNRADAALYSAKQKGKDCVDVAAVPIVGL